jgi:hypothetical protein
MEVVGQLYFCYDLEVSIYSKLVQSSSRATPFNNEICTLYNVMVSGQITGIDTCMVLMSVEYLR